MSALSHRLALREHSHADFLERVGQLRKGADGLVGLARIEVQVHRQGDRLCSAGISPANQRPAARVLAVK
jgi:hypothetical protein